MAEMFYLLDQSLVCKVDRFEFLDWLYSIGGGGRKALAALSWFERVWLELVFSVCSVFGQTRMAEVAMHRTRFGYLVLNQLTVCPYLQIQYPDGRRNNCFWSI